MGTSLGVADTMALISSKLSNLVPFSCCALFLHNEELETLRCRFATGIDAEVIQQISVKSGLGLTGWVARNRRTLVNARPSADLEAAGISATTSLQSALVCPLVFNERFIGTLSVYHIDAGCYTDDHRRLLDRVCEQAAAVIYNSIVFEQTQEDSLTDPLTGLPNTRFMFMHLTRELARAERLKSEVSLLVMDLDNFKEINDNHGHHVGDRALREVAGVLRAAIRPYDICVRYAGDEFIVVLSGCGADEAERKRVELQTAIDEVVFEARPGKRLQLGISIGAAVFPHDGNTYETLLATADSRMYRDKTKRKRVLVTKLGAEPCPSRREPAPTPSATSSSSAPRRACSSHSGSIQSGRRPPIPAAGARRRSRRNQPEPIGHRRLPGKSCISSHTAGATSTRPSTIATGRLSTSRSNHPRSTLQRAMIDLQILDFRSNSGTRSMLTSLSATRSPRRRARTSQAGSPGAVVSLSRRTGRVSAAARRRETAAVLDRISARRNGAARPDRVSGADRNRRCRPGSRPICSPGHAGRRSMGRWDRSRSRHIRASAGSSSSPAARASRRCDRCSGTRCWPSAPGRWR